MPRRDRIALAVAAGAAALVATVAAISIHLGEPADIATMPTPVAHPSAAKPTIAPKHTAAPDAAGDADSDGDTSHTPILLLVDPASNTGWQVERAVEAWNDATGCALFTLAPDNQAHDTYVVRETPGLRNTDGSRERGLTRYTEPGTPGEVDLDPGYGVDWHVPLHELGHIVLGPEHSHDPAGVMNVDPLPDHTRVAEHVAGPSAAEATQARLLQKARCS